MYSIWGYPREYLLAIANAENGSKGREGCVPIYPGNLIA